MKKTVKKQLPAAGANKSAREHNRLRRAFNSIGFPFITVDKNLKKIEDANEKYVEAFGKASLITEFVETIKTGRKDAFLTAMESAQSTGKEKSVSFSFEKKNWKARIFPFSSGLSITFEPGKKPAQSADYYEAVFDSMGDLFLLTDSDYNVVDANQPYCNALKMQKDELLKMKSHELSRELDQSKIRQLQSRAKEKPLMFDVIARQKDGREIDYEVNYFPVTIRGEKHFGSISRDVTEFKNAQRNLVQSNQRFELIAAATMEGLWEMDLVTNTKWANEVHQKYYGLTTKDQVPSAYAWEGRIHPADRQRIVKTQEKAIAKKKTRFITEYWFNTNEGSYIYIYDRTLLIYNDAGDLIKMMGSMVDVTALKNAQEQLSNQKNLSEGIINSLPGVFFLLDRAGKFIRWNKNFERITGYSADEINRMHAYDFVYHTETEGIRIKISEVFQKGKAEMEANLINKDGLGRPFYLTGWRTIIGNEECLIGTGMDISEMKKAQESIKRMELKITEQRIQEQKTISRAIINAQEKERNHIGRELHDNVNQLLAGARLYLTMGAKRSDEFAEMIKYPLELLDNGIQEIRYLTHRNITPSKDVDLQQLLEGIRDVLRAGGMQCALDIRIKKALNENLLINVYRILQEQASNIIKHSEAKKVSIKIYNKGSYLYIATTDDGVGFDVHKLREGIGLYNIYSRVEAYNGEVEIESEPGRGCRIEIKIPAFESKESIPYKADAAAEANSVFQQTLADS